MNAPPDAPRNAPPPDLPDAARPLPNLRCPLCGGPNGCVPAACGRFDVDCWCRDARFAPELLQRVPPAERGQACICARCAAGAVAG